MIKPCTLQNNCLQPATSAHIQQVAQAPQPWLSSPAPNTPCLCGKLERGWKGLCCKASWHNKHVRCFECCQAPPLALEGAGDAQPLQVSGCAPTFDLPGALPGVRGKTRIQVQLPAILPFHGAVLPSALSLLLLWDLTSCFPQNHW